MSIYSEEDIERAMEAVRNGRYLIRAARDYDIPRSTLRDRIRGAESVRTSHEFQQRLSIHQDSRLVTWALAQGEIGNPPTHTQLKLFAQRGLQAARDDTTLGKHWIGRFLACNPRLATIRSRPLVNSRVNGASPGNIKEFFKKRESPAIQEILPENRWNMDEIGI